MTLAGSSHRRAGRAAAPLLLALVGAGFIALLIYQVSRSTSDSGDELPPPPPPTVAPPAAAESETAPPETARRQADRFAHDPLEDEAEVRKTIEELLAALITSRAGDPAALREFHERRAALVDYLSSLPEEFGIVVLEYLDGEPDFVKRRAILEALGNIGGDVVASGLADHYEKMFELDKESEVAYTIKALGAVDNDLSYTLLTDYIDNAKSPDHRPKFVEALGEHSRRAESIPLFTDLVEHDGMVNVRNKAAQALKKTADPSAAADLERLLVEKQDNQYVRQTMIGALGAMRDPASIKVLEKIALEDQEVGTRLSAVRSIANIGGTEAKLALERIAEGKNAERVRKWARAEVANLEERGF